MMSVIDPILWVGGTTARLQSSVFDSVEDRKVEESGDGLGDNRCEEPQTHYFS